MYGGSESSSPQQATLVQTDNGSQGKDDTLTSRGASPVARLAPELLVLIFEHGHQGYLTPFSHVVSSVCRYWRTVATGTPSLWSPIVFEEGLGNTTCLNLARLYLKRSTSYPMDIVVNFVAPEFLQMFQDEMVTPHLHHCRSLSVESDSDCLLALIIHLGLVRTLVLEKLELASTSALFDAETLQAWMKPRNQPLFDGPNLRTVRIDMIPLYLTEAVSCLRLDNVSSFWFRWYSDEASSNASTQIIRIVETMSTLRELTLICSSPDVETSPMPLLSRLPPTLTSLEVSGVLVLWDIEHNNWLARDFSSLRTLRFTFTTSEQPVDADLFKLLALTPHLRELYVGSLNLNPHPHVPVLPVCLLHLARLTLEYCVQRTVQTFVESLTSPALIKATFIAPLQFYGGSVSDEERQDSIVSAFWSSCFCVEHITISHGCTLGSNGDLLNVLRTLRHVKSLDLRGRSGWNDMLLTGLGTEPWPCPALEAVSFSYISFTQGALESFLLARRRGFIAGQCAAIKVVRMRGCSLLKSTDTLEAVVDEVWHWI